MIDFSTAMTEFMNNPGQEVTPAEVEQLFVQGKIVSVDMVRDHSDAPGTWTDMNFVIKDNAGKYALVWIVGSTTPDGDATNDISTFHVYARKLL